MRIAKVSKNINAFAFKSFFNFALGVLLTVFISCNRVSENNTLSEQQSTLFYNEKYRALYINCCNISELPDSILHKDIRQLVITCPKLNDFDILYNWLNPEKIFYLRIDDLNQSVANLDVSRFKKLRTIAVFGTEKVNKINLLNIGDSLKFLQLGAPNLDFPFFDSAFLNLTSFYYKGRADVVPQWIERLDHLERFVFRSRRLSAIQSDVCKMESIYIFAIVDSEINDKELYISRMSVYPLIQKFRSCKPELYFWNVLPPR